MKKLVLLGAGGHGKVVGEIAELMQEWDDIEFLDDRFPGVSEHLNWKVTGKFLDYDKFDKLEAEFGVSIGDNHIRLNFIEKLSNEGYHCPRFIHPAATVSKNVKVGDASVIMPNVTINIDCIVEEACIINTASIIEHDCTIQKGAHISPGAKLGGGVKVGKYSWIGIGASIIPNVKIGNKVTIGAGSVVINDIEDGITVAGNPAKIIKKS
jgi:sugar O-acyltransferase (sialic acid O-acetyltransferase NeuD family)